MRFYHFSLLVVFVFFIPAMAKPPEPATGNVEGLWGDLADLDAAKAYRAIWALTKTPKETVAYISVQLKPVVAPDPRKVEGLIDDLNSETFAIREKANQELAKLGELVESALRKKLEAGPTLEARQRIERLVSRLLGPIHVPDQLRQIRAVETLEIIGSDAAKELLAKYAARAESARLTKDAHEALARLKNAEPSTIELPASRTDLYGDALPSGAVGRLGTIRFRRNEAYFSGGGLTFYPDGKAIVTRGGEHEIQVWDFPSGRLLHEFSAHPLYIRGFALAPDCKRFAVAGFYPRVANMAGAREIKVMDLPVGKVIKTFARTGNGDSSQLAFSPDGKLLFSLDNREGILRIEEIASGKELAQRKFPADVTGGMALSKDGDYVALASGPNTRKLFLWKWRDEEPQQIALPVQRIGQVGFSPDGKLLAAVEDFGSLFVWEVAGGRLLYRKESNDPGFSIFGKPVFSPDGKTLAVPLRGNSSFRGKIQFFEPATGRSQGILETDTESYSLAFAPDSQILVVTVGCGLRFWNVATRKEITATGEAHENYASQIVVSPKGFLATAGDDGSVRLWDAATTKQRWKFTAGHWVRALALSPDGSLVAASSLDDAVHVLDSRGGREIYRLAGHGKHGGQRTLGFFPDSKRLASWGDDYYLRVWDIKTGKARLEHAIRPKGIDFPDEEDAGGRNLKRFALDLAANKLSPDAKTFVLDIGGHFHLFDTGTGKETFTIASEGRSRESLAISPNGKYLLASSYGDAQVGEHPLALVDLSSGSTLQKLFVPGTGAGRSAFAADGRTFATTVDGPQAEIILYETASGKVRTTLRGFRGRVQSLAFFPDGRRLASGQSDSTVLIWDLSAPEHAKKGP